MMKVQGRVFTYSDLDSPAIQSFVGSEFDPCIHPLFDLVTAAKGPKLVRVECSGEAYHIILTTLRFHQT
jgi:hypothetical protein